MTTAQRVAKPRSRGNRGFTLLESGRVLGAWAVARTFLGMVLHLSVVSGSVVATSIDYRRAVEELAAIEAEMPKYVAPVKKEVGRAAQERLSFIGLKSELPLESDGPPSPLSTAVIENSGELEVAAVPEEQASPLEEVALSEIEVDSAVTTDPSSGGPSYPPKLLEARVEGEVLVRFIVDSLGRADPTSFIAVQTSDTAFTNAVRAALPLMKFRPARLRGIPVSQVVVQSFAFRIAEQPKDSSLSPILPGRGNQQR